MAAKIEKDRQQLLVSNKAHRQWEREQERSVIESQVTETQRRQQLLKNRQKQQNERVHSRVNFKCCDLLQSTPIVFFVAFFVGLFI